jgi:hypothetical protein
MVERIVRDARWWQHVVMEARQRPSGGGGSNAGVGRCWPAWGEDEVSKERCGDEEEWGVCRE